MYINQRTLLEFNHTFSIGNHFFPGLFVKHNSYSTETKKYITIPHTFVHWGEGSYKNKRSNNTYIISIKTLTSKSVGVGVLQLHIVATKN